MEHSAVSRVSTQLDSADPESTPLLLLLPALPLPPPLPPEVPPVPPLPPEVPPVLPEVLLRLARGGPADNVCI